jgi:hypothetical protein
VSSAQSLVHAKCSITLNRMDEWKTKQNSDIECISTWVKKRPEGQSQDWARSQSSPPNSLRNQELEF